MSPNSSSLLSFLSEWLQLIAISDRILLCNTTGKVHCVLLWMSLCHWMYWAVTDSMNTLSSYYHENTREWSSDHILFLYLLVILLFLLIFQCWIDIGRKDGTSLRHSLQSIQSIHSYLISCPSSLRSPFDPSSSFSHSPQLISRGIFSSLFLHKANRNDHRSRVYMTEIKHYPTVSIVLTSVFIWKNNEVTAIF